MTSNEKQVLLKKFGYRLAVLRARNRMSLRLLAAASRIDPSDIVKYEKGLVCPSLITIASLARGLDVEPHELLTFENKPPNPIITIKNTGYHHRKI